MIPSSDLDYDDDSGSEYIPYKNLSDNDTCWQSDVSDVFGNVKKPVISSIPSITMNAPILGNTIEYDCIENASIVSRIENRPKCIRSKDFNFEGCVETSKRKGVINKRVWDMKDHCLFCDKNIINFTRHLLQKHKNEIEVAKLESFSKGSMETKNQANMLRKRGNFMLNMKEIKKLKPVRRPKNTLTSTSAKDYLPCKYCFGMYKSKYLYSLFKIC